MQAEVQAMNMILYLLGHVRLQRVRSKPPTTSGVNAAFWGTHQQIPSKSQYCIRNSEHGIIKCY
eukprot:3648143-Amphidinium_carterae.1